MIIIQIFITIDCIKRTLIMQGLKNNILPCSEYIIKFFVCRYMSFVIHSSYRIYYFKMISLMFLQVKNCGFKVVYFFIF